jgi:hypothetical protein
LITCIPAEIISGAHMSDCCCSLNEHGSPSVGKKNRN